MVKKKNLTQEQIINKLKKQGFIKNNTLKVRMNSSNASIKKGDFVITFGIHKVKERFEHDKKDFSCVDVLPVAEY